MGSKVEIIQQMFKEALRLSRWFGISPVHGSAVLAYSRAFYIYGIVGVIFMDTLYAVQATGRILTNDKFYTPPRLIKLSLHLLLINWIVFKASSRLKRWIEYSNTLNSISLQRGSNVSRGCSTARYFVVAAVVVLFAWLVWDYYAVDIACFNISCLRWNILVRMLLEIFSNSTTYMAVVITTFLHSFLMLLTHYSLVNVNEDLKELQHDILDENIEISGGANIFYSDFSSCVTLRRKAYDDSVQREVASKIRTTASSYLYICDVIATVSRCDGLSILTSLAYIMSHLTMFGVAVLSGLYVGDDLFGKVSITLWNLLHFFRLMMLTEPCHRTHQQMEETVKLINRLKCRWCEYDSVLNELNLFKVTTELNTVMYSPLNIFTLNRPLAVKVILCAVTYFIMVFQFN